MVNHDSVDMGLKLIEEVLDKKSAPEICKGCANKDMHGDGCWFYWEAKKVCPQFVGSE